MLAIGAALYLVIRPDGYCLNLRAFLSSFCLLPDTGILFGLELLAKQSNIENTVFSTLIKQAYKSYGILGRVKNVS